MALGLTEARLSVTRFHKCKETEAPGPSLCSAIPHTGRIDQGYSPDPDFYGP